MSGFWSAEPVGPMTPEESQAFADAIYSTCESRTHAEFMYQLTSWNPGEMDQVLCLRRLVEAGVIGLGE